MKNFSQCSAELILSAPMLPNDAGAKTFRDYFSRILLALWNEGESFSGKRPFGNSGWETELFRSLVAANLIEGKFDEDGYLESCDRSAGRNLISLAMESLGQQS